jgi:hypothetical protein
MHLALEDNALYIKKYQNLGPNHLDLIAAIAKVERSRENLTGRLVSFLKLIVPCHLSGIPLQKGFFPLSQRDFYFVNCC